jgi:hypothetical protein
MSEANHLRTAVTTAAVIVIVQVAIGLAAFVWLPDWPTRGQFGDVFGAANSLFSGLAFAGLIYAILLQREDLALQRKELELTRQELQRTAAAQEQSEVALRAQAESSARSTRLATINFLLEQYSSELRGMHGHAYTANDPRLAKMRELEARQARLLAIIDRMYVEVTADTGDQ